MLAIFPLEDASQQETCCQGPGAAVEAMTEIDRMNRMRRAAGKSVAAVEPYILVMCCMATLARRTASISLLSDQRSTRSPASKRSASHWAETCWCRPSSRPRQPGAAVSYRSIVTACAVYATRA
jgi:hypothetical protein